MGNMTGAYFAGPRRLPTIHSGIQYQHATRSLIISVTCSDELFPVSKSFNPFNLKQNSTIDSIGSAIASVLLLAVILTSCEGGTTFTKDIQNASSDTITVSVYPSTGSGPVTISPGETRTVWLYDRDRLFAGDDYTCVSDLDSIVISVSGDKTLAIDPMISGHWERESTDGRNSKENCTLTIADEDLQGS